MHICCQAEVACCIVLYMGSASKSQDQYGKPAPLLEQCTRTIHITFYRFIITGNIYYSWSSIEFFFAFGSSFYYPFFGDGSYWTPLMEMTFLLDVNCIPYSRMRVYLHYIHVMCTESIWLGLLFQDHPKPYIFAVTRY